MEKEPKTEPREAGGQDFLVKCVQRGLRGAEQPVVDSVVRFSDLSEDGRYRAWFEYNGTRLGLAEKVGKGKIEETRAALLRGTSITPTVYVLLENSDRGRSH